MPQKEDKVIWRLFIEIATECLLCICTMEKGNMSYLLAYSLLVSSCIE